MPSRHHLPTIWLMTDERIADPVAVARRLPVGAGIVFRHHHTSSAERRRLFARLRRVAITRRLVLVRAGAMPLAGEAGVHGRQRRRRAASLRTHPAHDAREALAARRAGARVLFVSPVFATRSHPGARPLGPLRAAPIGRLPGMARVALGGMDARRHRAVAPLGFSGWAAIDALAGHMRRRRAPVAGPAIAY